MSEPRLPGDWDLAPFDLLPRTRLIFGFGVVRRVGECVAELGARRVLLVTDPGIVRAGHAQTVSAFLKQHATDLCIHDQARENPDTRCVEACVAVAREFAPDIIVGLGGGSAMDTAKACNFILTNGGRMQDYWGVGKATLPMLPFLAIPTTAGTGSECQSAALIADSESHQKMACLDPKAAARVAILDPELTLSQPAGVTACTGMDALSHAIETAVTSRRTAASSMYSREAIRNLLPALPRVLACPGDRDARARMLLGAALAGCAIEASMLGAAHAAANPLTAHHGLPHGVAVGLMLPHVIRFNALDDRVAGTLAEIAAAGGLAPSNSSPSQVACQLADHIQAILPLAGLPSDLASTGVQEENLKRLAEEASRQWTAGFNPRPVDAGAFMELYRAAMRHPAGTGENPLAFPP